MTTPQQAPSIGNRLNRIVMAAQAALFDQGEFAQLTYGALDAAATAVRQGDDSAVEVHFPVGYQADQTPLMSHRTYEREQLVSRYGFLASHQLAINGLTHLVATIESMLSEVVRTVVLRYPKKLSAKRTVALQSVLEAKSLAEIHLRATDTLLNEMGYKSPAEFAEEAEKLLSVNLLECPSFHQYIEIKAARDIFVHNRGEVNDVYLKKAGAIARARLGERLPATVQYFLQSYEHCLRLVEWLEEELHDHWHSSEHEERRDRQLPLFERDDGQGAPGDA